MKYLVIITLYKIYLMKLFCLEINLKWLRSVRLLQVQQIQRLQHQNSCYTAKNLKVRAAIQFANNQKQQVLISAWSGQRKTHLGDTKHYTHTVLKFKHPEVTRESRSVWEIFSVTTPSSSLPKERSFATAFLDPMSQPVQAVLFHTKHHQVLEWLARENCVREQSRQQECLSVDSYPPPPTVHW